MEQNFETLMGKTAAGLRYNHFENDCSFIIEKLEAAKNSLDEENDDESEFYGYYEELIELFNIISTPDYKQLKKELKKFIDGLSWENFQPEEDEEDYSIGSMYWNKLTWIAEATQNEAKQVAEQLVDNIAALLDYVETTFYNSKKSKKK